VTSVAGAAATRAVKRLRAAMNFIVLAANAQVAGFWRVWKLEGWALQDAF
jgi:hypothetical protein